MPESTRQLVAIMFTDIVGYTVLMGDEEEKALNLLERNRQLQKPLIEAFGGKWVKELGDGLLATFPTVSDAVYCAAAIQQGSKDDPDLNLRIGIHQGEVVIQDGDVFGDGVNIASRIESLAPTGGIWVSEAVSRNIQNKHGIKTLFVREEQLKNVKDPVKIYEIKAADVELPEPSGSSHVTDPARSPSINKSTYLALAILIIAALSFWGYTRFYDSPAVQEEDVTIAVLAFDDQSPNGDQEWLGDGMADEILNVLAKVRGLQVTGKTSSFSFKGKNATIKEIGEALNVKTVLEGSVVKVGNKLRITAQLIDVETDRHIWSKKYDRDEADIFAIIDEVAQSIAGELRSELSLDELTNIKAGHEVEPKAYEYFLIGEHFFYNKFYYSKNDDDFMQSEKMYLKAIEIDSVYVEAYTGLVGLYYQKIWTDIKTGNQYDRKVDSLVNIAYSLNPNSAYVLQAKGESFLKINNRNVDSAYYYFNKAHNLEPGNIIYSYALVGSIMYLGLYEKSNTMSEKLLISDPLNLRIRSYYARSLKSLGEYNEARMQLLKMIAIDPINIYANKGLLGIALFYDNDLSEAKRMYQLLEQISPNTNKRQEGWILGAEGKKEEALNTAKSIGLYSLLGMKEEALNLVDSLSRDFRYIGFKYNDLLNSIYFDFIRDEPKFQKILAKAKVEHEERVAKYGHLFD